jgi:hypothetical protein
MQLRRVYKVRMFGDDRGWERVEPIFYPCTQEQHETVISFLQSITDVSEIRWNELGSQQGHYVRPRWNMTIVNIEEE